MSAQTDCEMLSIEVMEAGIVSYRKGIAGDRKRFMG